TMKVFCMILVMISSTHGSDCNPGCQQQTYAKLPVPKLPDEIKDQILEVSPFISKIACANKCNSITDCRLACHTENQCTLLNVFMSPNWNASLGDFDLAFEYQACYTSWWNNKDVTPKA
ncbi:unnamed protein product, partial [Meganyctiphanes norvegica]